MRRPRRLSSSSASAGDSRSRKPRGAGQLAGPRQQRGATPVRGRELGRVDADTARQRRAAVAARRRSSSSERPLRRRRRRHRRCRAGPCRRRPGLRRSAVRATVVAPGVAPPSAGPSAPPSAPPSCAPGAAPPSAGPFGPAVGAAVVRAGHGPAVGRAFRAARTGRAHVVVVESHRLAPSRSPPPASLTGAFSPPRYPLAIFRNAAFRSRPLPECRCRMRPVGRTPILEAMIIVGTSGWQYRDWRGRFYPDRAAAEASGWSTTPRSSRPSRSTTPSTGCPSARRSRTGASVRRTTSAWP